MTSYLYNVDMAKEKLTIYLSAEVAALMRVSAARRGIKDSDLVEEALRDRLRDRGDPRALVGAQR